MLVSENSTRREPGRCCHVGGQGDVDPELTATLAQDEARRVDGQDVVVDDQAQRLRVVLQGRPGGGARVLATAAYLEPDRPHQRTDQRVLTV